jgi:hypothetical protein
MVAVAVVVLSTAGVEGATVAGHSLKHRGRDVLVHTRVVHCVFCPFSQKQVLHPSKYSQQPTGHAFGSAVVVVKVADVDVTVAVVMEVVDTVVVVTVMEVTDVSVVVDVPVVVRSAHEKSPTMNASIALLTASTTSSASLQSLVPCTIKIWSNVHPSDPLAPASFKIELIWAAVVLQLLPPRPAYPKSATDELMQPTPTFLKPLSKL